MKKMNILKHLYISALFALMVGCAGIPAEVPELSIELGKRISDLQNSNINLLHRFFALKRTEVDRFIEQQWVPLFTKEFYSDPKIAGMWDSIVSEDNKEDRHILSVRIGPRLQRKINSKRLEMIRPLDDLEKHIEEKIKGKYDQVRAINESITNFLVSASNLSERRRRYLEATGIKDEQLVHIINKTDYIVSSLFKRNKEAGEITEEYLENIRSVKDNL
ncbi:MAG: hypothetical protein GY795_48255 [Desulfobacterales bacterium]|nr:hypothetical protein [Desulfobacterales bacterium]